MKFFVLGLPHTQTTKQFTTCAYTQKVFHLCRMLTRRGHSVTHLGVEGSDPECDENIPVVDYSEWAKLYGHPGEKFYNLESQAPQYREYHERFAARVRRAIEDSTLTSCEAFVCVTWGGAQREAVRDLPQIVVESGIGYPDTFAPYRVFESYAWMHMIYGKEDRFGGGGWYDAVIPNAFDVDDFEYRPSKSDYFLYLGRLIDQKGVKIACDVARRAGSKIKIVGQGDPAPYLSLGNHVEYLPPVGVAERRELLAGARALLCPTVYVEPFGGVNVEAQLSGTPVICTDWGVFPETVIHGITGYRCRTMDHFDWAARNVDQLRPRDCRAWAVNNFSLERVALQYEDYFGDLGRLVRSGAWAGAHPQLKPHMWGWNESNPSRTQLDFLAKQYPESAASVRVDVNRCLEVSPDPAPPSPEEIWKEAHAFESSWWGLDPNPRWSEEQVKQETYARLSGIPTVRPGRVLDVGGGPVSLLLSRLPPGWPDESCPESVVVDPLPVTDATVKRYSDRRVTYIRLKAEEIELRPDAPLDAFGSQFDEVWIYNCLQHTEDPTKVLRNALGLCRGVVRIFEWIHAKADVGHPHVLTEALFDVALPAGEWDREIWNAGRLSCDMLHGEYVAIAARRSNCEHPRPPTYPVAG